MADCLRSCVEQWINQVGPDNYNHHHDNHHHDKHCPHGTHIDDQILVGEHAPSSGLRTSRIAIAQGQYSCSHPEGFKSILVPIQKVLKVF